MIESALLLFLVIDPFGNLPFVLAVLSGSEKKHYRKTILRETFLALIVLVVFTLMGEALLGYLGIERASLMVAGGVILFLISLKMIFQSAREVFAGDYRPDSFFFPDSRSLSGWAVCDYNRYDFAFSAADRFGGTAAGLVAGVEHHLFCLFTRT